MGTPTPRKQGVRESDRRPLVVIEAKSTPLGQYLRDLKYHRDLVQVLGLREITLRYRQTALGVVWVVLQPLLSAGVLSFVFGRVAKLPTDGIPSFTFTLAGMLAWNTFSGSCLRTTLSISRNSGMIAKVFFPRLVLPFSTVLSSVLDFLVPLVFFFVVAATSGVSLSWTLVYLPLWLTALLLLSLGIGTILAALAVRYHDIPSITPVLLQLILYSSPVAYAVSAVPERYVNLYYFNPLASLFEAFRWSLVGTPFPPTGRLVYSISFGLVAFVVGFVTLEKTEGRFADVI